MNYNSDIRKIRQFIKGEMKYNKEPTMQEIITWCVISYQNGRIAMGESRDEYEIERREE